MRLGIPNCRQMAATAEVALELESLDHAAGLRSKFRRANPHVTYSIDMDRRVSLTAVYEPVDNGWVQARIREMPGVITTAPTRAEAEDLVLDALREFLLSFSKDVEGDETTYGDDVQPVQIVLSA